jgi:hypothetical protein
MKNVMLYSIVPLETIFERSLQDIYVYIYI